MYIRSVFPRSTFGSSFSFLAVAFRFAMGEEEGRVGGERRREKRGESTGCCRRAGTGFHALKYLSVGSTRARRSGCAGREAKNSVKKESPFWDPSIKDERTREPRGAHPSLTRRSPCLTCSRGASV